MWYFTFQDIDFFEKYLIKNGENDISELLDFKLSWGSMPLNPNTCLAPLCSLRFLDDVVDICAKKLKEGWARRSTNAEWSPANWTKWMGLQVLKYSSSFLSQAY